jgi:hypothetical protein
MLFVLTHGRESEAVAYVYLKTGRTKSTNTLVRFFYTYEDPRVAYQRSMEYGTVGRSPIIRTLERM